MTKTERLNPGLTLLLSVSTCGGIAMQAGCGALPIVGCASLALEAGPLALGGADPSDPEAACEFAELNLRLIDSGCLDLIPTSLTGGVGASTEELRQAAEQQLEDLGCR